MLTKDVLTNKILNKFGYNPSYYFIKTVTNFYLEIFVSLWTDCLLNFTKLFLKNEE